MPCRTESAPPHHNIQSSPSFNHESFISHTIDVNFFGADWCFSVSTERWSTWSLAVIWDVYLWWWVQNFARYLRCFISLLWLWLPWNDTASSIPQATSVRSLWLQFDAVSALTSQPWSGQWSLFVRTISPQAATVVSYLVLCNSIGWLPLSFRSISSHPLRSTDNTRVVNAGLKTRRPWLPSYIHGWIVSPWRIAQLYVYWLSRRSYLPRSIRLASLISTQFNRLIWLAVREPLALYI